MGGNFEQKKTSPKFRGGKILNFIGENYSIIFEVRNIQFRFSHLLKLEFPIYNHTRNLNRICRKFVLHSLN